MGAIGAEDKIADDMPTLTPRLALGDGTRFDVTSASYSIRRGFLCLAKEGPYQ